MNLPSISIGFKLILALLIVTIAPLTSAHANGQYSQAQAGPIYQTGQAPLWSPIPGTVFTSPYGTALPNASPVPQYPYSPISRPNRVYLQQFRPAAPVYRNVPVPEYRLRDHGGYSVQGRSGIVRMAPTIPILSALSIGMMAYESYKNPQQFWSEINNSVVPPHSYTIQERF